MTIMLLLYNLTGVLSVSRSVQCAVGCLLEPVKTSNDDHLLGGVLTELPCGCEMTSETDPPMISAKGVWSTVQVMVNFMKYIDSPSDGLG